MTKKQKAKMIAAFLEALFPTPDIPLYHFSPYTLLIAVLLSAQSTDRMVNRVTPKLFDLASTPKEMIALSYDAIRDIIRPCGLSPRKAKAILGLSHMLLDEYGGDVPNTFEDLERLPGVGHKTASVVMAQAFNIPAFPVDTHIFRCARKWGLSTGKSVEKVEEDLKTLFPKKDWIKRHLQIIYYARAYCPARGHNVENCPICLKLLS